MEKKKLGGFLNFISIGHSVSLYIHFEALSTTEILTIITINNNVRNSGNNNKILFKLR